MMERVCFLIYKDWEEVFEQLDDKSFRELITSIIRYGFRREESELSPMAKIAMTLIKPVLDRDWEKYLEIVKRNKANGLRGGRPKTQENPENPLGYLGFSKNPEEPNETQENPKNLDNIINEKGKKKKENNNIIIEDKSSLSTEVDLEAVSEPKEIMDFYNNSVRGSNISSCVKLTETRKRAVKARLNEFGKEQIFLAITKAVESKFLNGSNDRNWHADFDWIFNAKNMAKILESKYDDNLNYGNDRKDNQSKAIRAGVGAFQQLWDERNS